MAITTDEKGEDIIEIFSSEDHKIQDHTISLYRGDFYLHYPYKRSALVAFGLQDRYRLGTGKKDGEALFANI